MGSTLDPSSSWHSLSLYTPLFGTNQGRKEEEEDTKHGGVFSVHQCPPRGRPFSSSTNSITATNRRNNKQYTGGFFYTRLAKQLTLFLRTKAQEEPIFELTKPSTGQEYKCETTTQHRPNDTRGLQEQITTLHLQPANER